MKVLNYEFRNIRCIVVVTFDTGLKSIREGGEAIFLHVLISVVFENSVVITCTVLKSDVGKDNNNSNNANVIVVIDEHVNRT